MNVVVWRLPRGESLVYPPSHCPKCGHAIKPWENIPIISWLCLRARCSNCHLPISVKYPLGEGATGLLFAFVWMRVFLRGLPLECIPAFFYLVGALLAAGLIDGEHRFIPDEVTFSGMLFALLMAILLPQGRLALQSQPNPHSGALIYTGFREMLLAKGVDLAAHSVLASVADCLLGAAMGYAVLTLFSWSAKHFFGNVSRCFKEPVQATLSKDGILLQENTRTWDDLLDEPEDTLFIHGVPENGSGIVKIMANAKGGSLDGQAFDWDKKKKLEIRIASFSASRDVIGYGDVKLLAMIGAFLGADATIYILLTGALIAIAYALLAMLVRRRFMPSLPFGPFLAIASLLWMLFGNLAFSILS